MANTKITFDARIPQSVQEQLKEFAPQITQVIVTARDEGLTDYVVSVISLNNGLTTVTAVPKARLREVLLGLSEAALAACRGLVDKLTEADPQDAIRALFIHEPSRSIRALSFNLTELPMGSTGGLLGWSPVVGSA